MKKEYQEPKLIIELFLGQDIIASGFSGGGTGSDEPDPEEPNLDW